MASKQILRGRLSEREKVWNERFTNRHPRLSRKTRDLIMHCTRQQASQPNAGKVWLPGEAMMMHDA